MAPASPENKKGGHAGASPEKSTPEKEKEEAAKGHTKADAGATPTDATEHHEHHDHLDPDSDKHSHHSIDSEEKRKREEDKKKKAKPKISKKERIRRIVKRILIFLRWACVHGFATITCHYRGRRRNLRRNHWVKIPDRPGRQLDLRTKREEYYDVRMHEMQTMVEQKKLKKWRMVFRKFRMDMENNYDDSCAYFAEKFRLNHRKTGLPRAVLEWFHFVELVNEGPHGMVYRAIDLHNRAVCVKVRDKSKGNLGHMPFRRAARVLKREVVVGFIPIFKLIRKVLSRCHIVRPSFEHANISMIYTVYNNAEFFVEVCEWLPGHTLQDYTEGLHHRMDEYHACNTFSQLMAAIQYLHARRLVHRDIRMNQILLPLKGKDEDIMPDVDNCKLCEGWCFMKLPRRGHYFDRPLCGDLATRAPEVITHNAWSKAADMWSAGCVLFELLFGHLPFGGEGARNKEALAERIVKQEPEFDKITGHVSPEGVDLCRRLLSRHPSHRPTAKQCMEHEWFNKYYGDKPGSHKHTDERMIRDVRIDGKMPACRRGMDPQNLLNPVVGMLSSGFCTFMGSTRCDIDFFIGGEGAREDHYYWVTSVLVSLWATDDNPKNITVYTSFRPNSTWSELVQYKVENEAVTEARIHVDKPVRYLRLAFNGNLGGVLGIALRKVIFYGYQIRFLPVRMDLDQSAFGRGSEIHIHNNTMAGEEVKAFPKYLVPYLEKGVRIAGTGQRYMVYRDVDSGPSHTQTVVAMHLPVSPTLPKRKTVVAAALQLRYLALQTTGSIPPKMRITIDDGGTTGRQFICSTTELWPSPWFPTDILTKGYEDAPVIYVDGLNLCTDEGLVIELNFENNGGHIHIPVEFGLALFYIPDLDSDDESDDEGSARGKKKKGQMSAQDKLVADLEKAAHHGEEEEDHWSDHAESEAYEVVLDGDQAAMRDIAKYGQWGAGNALQKEVNLWLPRAEDALHSASTQSPRHHGHHDKAKPLWWEVETDSEPDSWGTADSAPTSARPGVASGRDSTRRQSMSKLDAHSLARLTDYGPAGAPPPLAKNKKKDALSEDDSVELDGVDERGFVVKEDENNDEKYARLLEVPQEELTQAEQAFIVGHEREHEELRHATAKKVVKVKEQLELEYRLKKDAQQLARTEKNFRSLCHIRSDLLEEEGEDELRKLASHYEARYAADGSKKMVLVKEEGGFLWECTAGCREETGLDAIGASPCCERAKTCAIESVPAVLNPFTPPPPPSSPRKHDMRAMTFGNEKNDAGKGGCVMM